MHRSPTFASSSDVKDELDCSLSNEACHDDEADMNALPRSRVVLPNGEVYDEDHNGDFDEQYEENLGQQQYEYDENDSVQKFEVDANDEDFDQGLKFDPDEEGNKSRVPQVIVQYGEEDYEANEADFQGNEDEHSAAPEHSLNEEEDDDDDDDIEGDGEVLYGDEEYDEDFDNEDEQEMEGAENGIYSGEGKQANAVLNYGYSCKFCRKFFTTRRGVESHEQHHKNQSVHTVSRRFHESRVFPCKLCKSKTFSSFKELKMHVKTHTPERIHICKFCFSTFNNTASLTKHLNIHQTENPNKCFCGKTFVSANTLKIHKKIHTGIKPFVCNFYQCGRAFVTKSTLESHLRTHTGEKPYQCTLCPSSFTTSSAKYRHERHVHKIPENGSM